MEHVGLRQLLLAHLLITHDQGAACTMCCAFNGLTLSRFAKLAKRARLMRAHMVLVAAVLLGTRAGRINSRNYKSQAQRRRSQTHVQMQNTEFHQGYSRGMKLHESAEENLR